jgi:GT2 family glycosyltransferase/spore maturation protein CgeB
VILTRDGREHMERALTGLRDLTAYRSFEVIVVDNASSDGTDEVLRRDWGYPVEVIRNTENATFSAGNNQGIAVAKGEFVLLLNNDISPINEGWLGSMVEAVNASPDRAAAGALLIYPVRPKGLDLQGDTTRADLTVQHRGIGFWWHDGAPRGRNIGGGTDPFDPAIAPVGPMPAATAACFLVRKDALEAVGGLTEGYVYGTEDVDLCLKLRSAGHEIVLCGDAALFHHEFGTQKTVDRAVKRTNRESNLRLFVDRWAPQLSRSLRLDQLRGEGRWTARESRTVAITITRDDPSAGWGDWYTAHELGDALAAMGWVVLYAESGEDNWYYLPEYTDVVISLLDKFDVSRVPEGAYTIAWVRNWVDRWLANESFERFDLVVASSEIAADMIRTHSQHDPAVVPLAANPDRFKQLPPTPELICDYTFTGNNWAQGRALMDLIQVRPGERFSLYGKGWERTPATAPYRRGHIDFVRLPELYSSAKIVLDDTAEHTLPYGAVNSRVFEALACGALVITNNEIGAREMFNGELPTYSNAEELRAQLDRFLSDDDLRRKTVEALRRIVVSEHTYARRAERFTDLAIERVSRPRVALRIGPPDHARATHWGDTYFARDFARALRGLGFSTQIDILPEWDEPSRQNVDVVVHLWGLSRYLPKSSHLNLLWVISHPEKLDPAQCEMYDAVMVASETFAEELREKVSVPVHVLLQATATDRFKPSAIDEKLRTQVLFVGNSRGQRRDVVDWAIEARLPLTIYGSAWDAFVPKSYVKADFFPNERLPELYGAADVVLNDHWPDMRDYGFLSNRVLDALACGAFVVSDRNPALDAFGEAVPTFGSAAELREIVERYLNEPEERGRLAKRGTELVRTHHSFDARAAEFAEIVRPMLEGRPMTLEEAAAKD